MRKTLTYLGILLCLCLVTTTAMAQNGQFDVRFAIKNYDCATNGVTIQVQVKAHDAAHTFLMGDANYRFDYDPRVINTPTLVSQEMFSNQAPASDFNYNAQNLNGSSAGLTLGTVSLNTIYGGGGNAAKLVPATWTTVSLIRFTVQDPTKCFDLLWHDDTRFPITGMNEIEILGGGTYGQYIVPAGGVFTNYSACIPQVCGGITALNDINATLKNTVVSGNLLTNDNSPYALTATSTPFLNPAHGTITIAANGAYVYTPVSGYVGTDVAKYIVCNTAGLCDTASLFLNVLDAPVANVNSAPLAQNDNGITYVGMSLSGNVLANDIDAEKNTLTVNTTPLSMPTNGTLVLNADGTYVYTPVAGFVGTDAFQYTVCDNGVPSLCSTATVTIEVLNNTTGGSANLPPTANDDSYLTYKDTNVSGNLKSNDADPNTGQTLTYNTTPIANAAHGVVTINTDGTFTYVPTAGYLGPDAFQYAVCDNGSPSKCDTATAFVVITTAPNQAPLVTVTAQNIPEDVLTTFCLPIVDGNTLDTHTVTVCGITGGGTATAVVNNTTHQVCVTYLSALNYNGPASVCLNVCDNGTPSKCDNVTVPLTITPVNDKPIIALVNPLTTPEDVPFVFCATIGDVDAGSTFTSSSCGALHGTIATVINAGQVCVTYTPTLNYNGIDSMCIIVCDNGTPTLCDTLRVRMNVTPVNDNPVIVDLAPQTTSEDTPLNVCTTINDVDNDSPIFAATLCGVTNGTATPTITGNQLCLNFVPTLNYNGPATVCVIVCDNGIPSKCDTMNVAITVTPVNDAPVLTAVLPQTTLEDTPITFCTTITDVDAGQTFVATPCGVTNGTISTTVVGNQLCMTYTPNLNYNGPESICVNVCDNGSPSLCAQITVPITVTPVNDNPIIVDLTPKTTSEDTPLNVCTTINDVDVSSAFTATLCGVTNGTATPTIVGNQLCINYIPTLNYNGVATVCVIVCDNGSPSKCDTTTLTINVMPVNDKPVVTVVPIVVSEDGTTTVCMPITDPDVGNSFTSTSCGALHGSVSTAIVAGQVCVTYTPALNYYGIDSACVIVCDNGSPSKCDTIKAPITVTPVNDAPVVADGTATTLNSAPVTICVPILDVDPLDNHTVSVCGAPTMGSISTTINNATHQLCVTYTPNLIAVGVDLVCLNICDNGVPSKCDVSNLTFNIGSTNKAPVAMNDINSTLKNAPVSGNVLTNDSDPNTNTLTVSTTPVVAPKNGTVVLNANGTYTYTPAANFVGTDVFKYQVCDNGAPSMCTTATVSIEVREVLTAGTNQAPVASDDNTATPSGTTIVINVKANDFDPQGGTIYSPTLTGTAVGGVPSVNGDGTVTFVPTIGFVGDASFKYVICDNGMPILCDTATVNVTVYPNIAQGNVPPVANNDAFPILKDKPFVGNVSTNDYDQNAGQTLTYTATSTPLHGTVTVLSNGQFSYVPATGFVGVDSFKYSVCDNNTPTATCATATAYLNIAPALATPTNVAPVAMNDVTTTYTNSPTIINVKANDYDPNGSQVLSNPAIVGVPVGGTAVVNADGTVTFTPNVGFTGTGSFVYQVCDNGAPIMCVNATATVNVLPLPAIANRPPTAINDASTTVVNTSINGSASSNDSDPDAGQTLTYTRLTLPTNGISNLTSTGAYSYTPLSNFVGLDSFQYKICDNGNPSMCDTAWIVVNITNPIGATNVAPTVGNDNTATSINTAVVINVKANDYDLNIGQTLGLPTVVGTPIGGVATVNADGTITFTPTIGFTGVASFNYQVCDNGSPALCKTATVTVDVVGIVYYVNVAPSATNDATTTAMNTAVAGNAKTNDSDFNNGQTLSYALATSPVNGTMVMQASGAYVYTPNAGFVGLDSARYTVCDNASPSLCSTAWIYVQVTATGVNTNATPIVLSDVASTTQGIPVTINVKGNDYDPNSGQMLGLPMITGVVPNGTATVNADGTITFVPTAGFVGTSTFAYTICDNGSASLCVTASVTVTVLATPAPNGTNMPPSAMDDSYQVLKGTSIAGNLGLNDTDPNGGQTLTHSLLTNPTRGVVSLNANGTYTYTPNAGFTGTDQFIYKVCDNGNPSLCDTATVYITVYEFPCVTLTLKVLLEGPLSTTTGLMGTILNQRGLLPGQTPIGQFAVVTPVGHPYSGAPWNLVDTTGQSFRNYPSNAVDWVLVSLRASNASSVNVLRVPALLLNDGTVSFINPCFSLPNGNYFVLIEHRNHMGVMSPTAVAVVNGVLAFDFTTGNSLTSINVNDPPAFGQKAVGTRWAMHAGDGKKSTQTTNFDINFNDSQLWKLESGIFDQYRYGDFNMNADVNFQDQVLWKANNGRYSIIPH
jgi:large repetitive protein